MPCVKGRSSTKTSPRERSAQRRFPTLPSPTSSTFASYCAYHPASSADRQPPHRTLGISSGNGSANGLPFRCSCKPASSRSAISGGSAVSRLPSSLSSCRLVSWPISGGSAVSWLPSRSSFWRLVSWPISGGSAVSWLPSRIELLEAGELADLRAAARSAGCR